MRAALAGRWHEESIWARQCNADSHEVLRVCMPTAWDGWYSENAYPESSIYQIGLGLVNDQPWLGPCAPWNISNNSDAWWGLLWLAVGMKNPFEQGYAKPTALKFCVFACRHHAMADIPKMPTEHVFAGQCGACREWRCQNSVSLVHLTQSLWLENASTSKDHCYRRTCKMCLCFFFAGAQLARWLPHAKTLSFCRCARHTLIWTAKWMFKCNS